jgi:hypothetical protein
MERFGVVGEATKRAASDVRSRNAAGLLIEGKSSLDVLEAVLWMEGSWRAAVGTRSGDRVFDANFAK